MYREPYVLLAPEDAKRLKLRPGAPARITTATGTAEVRTRSEEGIPAGVAVLPTEYPSVLRTLVGTTEAGGLALDVVAAAIVPGGTR